MARTKPKDFSAFKRSYAQNPCIKTAAIAAGYAENTANQGLTPLAKPFRSWVLGKQRKLNRLAELGASLTAQQQENALRGAIFSNIHDGKDKAVGSIKLGMQDRRVNMLTPESMTGIIVIDSPRELPQLPQLQADSASVANSTE